MGGAKKGPQPLAGGGDYGAASGFRGVRGTPAPQRHTGRRGGGRSRPGSGSGARPGGSSGGALPPPWAGRGGRCPPVLCDEEDTNHGVWQDGCGGAKPLLKHPRLGFPPGTARKSLPRAPPSLAVGHSWPDVSVAEEASLRGGVVPEGRLHGYQKKTFFF